MRAGTERKEIVKKALAMLHEGEIGESQHQEVKDDLAPIRAWVVEEAREENGQLRAVQICSALLEAHLWVVWDRSFEPKDDLAIYFGEEMPLLKGKSLEDLKLIQETKLIFPGCRVVQ